MTTPHDLNRLCAEQMEIIDHALTGGTGREYRNHYAAPSGTEDYAACEKLTADGLMERGSALSYGHLFHVTEKGRAAFLASRGVRL